MANQMSIRYAERLAERWQAAEVTASDYYYKKARQALNLFRDRLSPDHHSLLAGLVEFYNHHK